MEATKTKKPVINVQVINMSCTCGGSCVSASGSYMIDASCETVACESCGEVYQVPASVFSKRLRG